ncbi:MAG: hypothetical protein L0177_06910 [Chloroflexi bacterium]|nr:hypothetical protein [Chloroflexota bacterium]
MLGTPRLLTFAFRALALVLIASMLWVFVARQYNAALVFLADAIAPGDASLKALGTRILIETSERGAPLSIDGFTLHYGLIMMAALVLAAVGVGVAARVRWLAAMCAGAFAAHVAGVALLASGVAWAGEDASSARLVFSVFAVFWGLLPAVAGGAWCWACWARRAPAWGG